MSPFGSRTTRAVVTGFGSRDFDYDEIRSLDAGSWFVAGLGVPRSARAFGTLDRLEPDWIDHCRSGRVIIPSLAEALSLTKELDWLVNIEIKSFPEQPSGLLDSVLDLIKDTGTADKVLISSFDHTVVEDANEGGREYALGILVDTPLYCVHKYVSQFVRADTVNMSAEYLGSQSINYRRHPSWLMLAGSVVEDLKRKASRPWSTQLMTTDREAWHSTLPRSGSMVCSPTIPRDLRQLLRHGPGPNAR